VAAIAKKILDMIENYENIKLVNVTIDGDLSINLIKLPELIDGDRHVQLILSEIEIKDSIIQGNVNFSNIHFLKSYVFSFILSS